MHPSVNVTPTELADFMDMVDLTPILRHIMPLVPQLPHSMALDLLRQKYIDFARRTRLLQTRIPLDYQSGVRDYHLKTPEGYEIFAVMGIESPHIGYYWYGFERLHFRNHVYYDIIDNNIIRLRHTPSVDRPHEFHVFACLLPCEHVTQIPRSLIVPYGRPLGLGVVADALMIPNKSWTSAQLSSSYRGDYERAVLSGRALAATNRKVQPSEFKPVRIL